MKIRLTLLLLPLLLWAGPAFGQGCAMCYSSARANTKDGLHAINRAVLVLLVPPIGFMTVGLGLAFRYGKKRDEDLNSKNPPSPTKDFYSASALPNPDQNTKPLTR